MVEKTLILKQISGMLCLLNSYSKFTQPKIEKALKESKSYVNLKSGQIKETLEF